jgi:hypothetical protein
MWTQGDTIDWQDSILRNEEIQTNIVATCRSCFPPEGDVGLVPKRGSLLTLAYYAFPR